VLYRQKYLTINEMRSLRSILRAVFRFMTDEVISRFHLSGGHEAGFPIFNANY
jgi:hypothetical protein